MSDAAPASRLPQLDAIRGLAFFAVLFEHWAGRQLNEWVPIGAGTLGIGLFFTLSGFLITGSLLSAAQSNDRPSHLLGQFYIRRVFRLFPAYYAVLLVLFLLDVRGVGQHWHWHAAYLTNIHVVLGGPQIAFWSLAVEEQFYLLWPLVFLLVPVRFRLRSAVTLVVLGLAFRASFVLMGIEPEFRLPMFQLEALGAGAVLACLAYRPGVGFRFDWLTPARARIFSGAAVAAFAGAALVWLLFGGTKGGMIRSALNEPLTAVFYVWVVCMAARGVGGPVGWVLYWPWLRYVGQISYGLYLVHSFVPTIIRQTAGDLPAVVEAGLAVVITFGVCALSWRYFEQPFIALGRRLADGLGRPARQPRFTHPRAPHPSPAE